MRHPSVSWPAVAAALIALGLIAAACGGGDDEGASEAPAPATPTEADAGPPQAPEPAREPEPAPEAEPEPAPEPEPMREPEPEPAPEPEPMREPEPEPEAESEPEPAPAAAFTISFAGVSFAADPSIVTSAQSSVVPAVAVGPGPGVGSGNPQFIRLVFNDAAIDDFFPPDPRIPQIHVYPVAEYGGLFEVEAIAGEIDDLRSLLRERDPGLLGSTLPHLPPQPAVQTFWAKFAFVDFVNGSGIRYITQFDQGPNPITNDSTFYTFQGLTDDGRYYVAAFFPIATSSLPATAAEVDIQAILADDFGAYIQETIATLFDLDAADFDPDLSRIDAMLASLLVEPALEEAAAHVNAFAYCANVGTNDFPLNDDRWGGAAMPAEIIAAVGQDFPFGWRCFEGAVLWCDVGANIPCSVQTIGEPSREPTEGMFVHCEVFPDADFIPAVATGRGGVFEWRCDGTQPVIVQQVLHLDERGFIDEFWSVVSTS